MERIREARRGSTAAMNGGGLSRRRQRSSGLRDSPGTEGDGGIEMTETSRLRERAVKRDRERDRSSRTKRRRGEKVMHGGGREEGEESFEESLDEEEEDDEYQAMTYRPAASSPAASSPASHNAPLRRSFPPSSLAAAKPLRPPVWKVADEMMGVSIPRKARTASGKRSLDYSVSGGGGGSGGGAEVHRQTPAAPVMPITASTAQASPSPSAPSARKKLKPGGGGSLQRPIKSLKPPVAQEAIEFEVAEVLFGMNRQFPLSIDLKDADGPVSEGKSGASSPNSQRSAHPHRSFSNQGTAAPKKKRQHKLEEPSTSPPAILEPEDQRQAKLENPEKSSTIPTSVEPVAIENSICYLDHLPQPPAVILDAQQDDTIKSVSDEDVRESKTLTEHSDAKAESKVSMEEANSSNLADGNLKQKENAKGNSDPSDDSSLEEKFSIDLMALPPGKSREREDCGKAHLPIQEEIELVSKIGDSRSKDERNITGHAEISQGDSKKRNAEEDLNLKNCSDKDKSVCLQSDLEKPVNEQEVMGTPNNPGEAQKQQSKSAKAEAKERAVISAVSLPLQMPPALSGSVPPFGYIGQIPPQQSVLPTDPNSGTSNQFQPVNVIPPPRPKRCATHLYIAKWTDYHHQLTKFWPKQAVTGAMQLYGGKQYSFNSLPPSEAAAQGSSLQGNFPRRNLLHSQGKAGSSVAGCVGNSSRGKSSVANNSLSEASQRKQQIMMLQQAPQPGSANNLLHGPTFIIPDQPLGGGGAAAALGPGAPKSTGTPKPAYEIDNTGQSSSTTANNLPGNAGVGTIPSMNFNCASSPNDAQYLAILQNNAHQFSNPVHGGASPCRATSLAQAMPFYGGSFYTSQAIHPSQLQQQHMASLSQSHSGHQNTSTSSGSSSSQKHPQHSQLVLSSGPAAPATAAVRSHSFPACKQGPHMSESCTNGNPVLFSQAQKGIYGHNNTMPVHQPNFALISPAVAAAALGSSGGHNEKQLGVQHQGVQVELTPNQAYAMSFTSLPAAAAAAAAPAGLDFSSVAPNHVFFQSPPDGVRHGYQMAPAAQSMQQLKKSRNHDDGKSQADSLIGNIASEEEKKIIASAKFAVGGSTQPLIFSKPENEALGPSNLSNSVMDSSSRTLNLIPAAHVGGRVPNLASNSAPSTSSLASAAVSSLNLQQQQQQQQQLQLLQFHKLQMQQHQQQLSARTKSSHNASAYTERLPANSTMNRLPQTLSNSPQVLIQGSGSPSQSPQWKGACGSAATLVTSPATLSSSSTKGQHPQQPNRIPQHTSIPAHQTQISFGPSSLKMSPGSTGPSGMPSLSSASSIMVGSFPSSFSKSAGGGGSPQRSSSGKSTSNLPTSLPLSQKPSDKISQSSSSLKPSTGNKRNMPSLLGHPPITPAPSSSSSSKQQQHSQLQQKTSYLPSSHLFFSSAYPPGQPGQSTASASTAAAAAAAAYYRHHSEVLTQQLQQHNTNPASVGVLSLGSSGLTLSAAATNDPAKAMVSAANLKGLQAPGLLQHPLQPSTTAQYPLISTAAGGFPYIHGMPTVSVKAPEQKPAAGNDSLNASRQTEKR